MALCARAATRLKVPAPSRATRLLPHRVAQMTVQRLDRALRGSFKCASHRKGFPRFKRRDDHADAFSFVGRECRFARDRIRLPKVGWVRVRGLTLPDSADAKVVAVTQEPTGWHLSVQFAAAPKDYGTPRYSAVGIDLGLADTATLSDGRRIPAFRPARRLAKRVRRLNRERDRRRKGSVNRRRTVARLGRLHRVIRDARQNFLHKTANLRHSTPGISIAAAFAICFAAMIDLSADAELPGLANRRHNFSFLHVRVRRQPCVSHLKAR